MATTAEDIALRVGCSTATVSRVLNGTGPVSMQTQEAVLKAIEAAGGLARRARRRRAGSSVAPANERFKQSGLIEIVMHLTSPVEHVEVVGSRIEVGPIAKCPPDRFFRPENRFTNTLFRRIIDGATDESNRWRLRPVVRTTDSLDDRLLLADLAEPEIQGLILLGNQGPEVEAFLRRCRCPFVSFIGASRANHPSVASDDVPGMRQAIAHLASLGHTRIGYIACPQQTPTFQQRYIAFKLAMLEAGLSIRPEWIFDQSVHMADIAAGAERILSSPDDRPTAMVCSYDGAAVGVMQAAERLGLSVPRDLSVIGFGNQDIADLTRPALTSVDVPAYDMGRAAVKLLMMQRIHPDPSGPGLGVRMSTQLVERASTAPAPTDLSSNHLSQPSSHSL